MSKSEKADAVRWQMIRREGHWDLSVSFLSSRLPEAQVFPWSSTVSSFLVGSAHGFALPGVRPSESAQQSGWARTGRATRSRGRARAPAAWEQEISKCGCSNEHMHPRTRIRGKGSGTPCHRLLRLRFFFVVPMEASSVKGLEGEDENGSVPHTVFYRFEIEKLVQTITFCLMRTYFNIGQRKDLSH